ncbi:MAG: hypothetical protein LBR47_04325, partial [Spirochaetaceae bacterium]|nr:hypothetical protein [Spirochaetaceae bacterium]
YENPSILASEDGLHFYEEFENINPLVPEPSTDHNDDPDLFYENGSWYILYLETLRPERQNLRLLESKNRRDWSNSIVREMKLSSDDSLFMLSPSYIVYDKASIFYVNRQPTGNRIEYITSASGIQDTFGSPCVLKTDMDDLNPWHIDIIKSTDNIFYMLLTTISVQKNKLKQYSLYLAKSENLREWTLSSRQILASSYRATGWIMQDDMYIYFSRETPLMKAWRIGVYKIKISDFFV